MIRLGLTQRVDIIEEYGERRDCLDQAWTDLLVRWGYQPVPLPNTVDEPAAYLSTMDLDGLVLSSGNDLAHLDGATQPAPERDAFERAAVEWAIDREIPAIGICRGLELLNDYFDGTLSTVDDHVATEHTISFETTTQKQTQTDNVDFPDQTQVNSYHNYGLTRDDVADDLAIVATASDGTVEAIAHTEHPLLGIMWHPERETPSVELDRKLFDGLFAPDNQ